jgi:hypothetical protein
MALLVVSCLLFEFCWSFCLLLVVLLVVGRFACLPCLLASIGAVSSMLPCLPAVHIAVQAPSRKSADEDPPTPTSFGRASFRTGSSMYLPGATAVR